MRGKVYSGLYDALQRRITPAYAGKSTLLIESFNEGVDHPRVCGEKQKQRCICV